MRKKVIKHLKHILKDDELLDALGRQRVAESIYRKLDEGMRHGIQHKSLTMAQGVRLDGLMRRKVKECG